MFYISESFYNYVSDYIINNIPTVLIGISTTYIWVVGTVLLCTKEENKDDDFNQIMKTLNWDRIMLMSTRGELDSISDCIMDNKDQLEQIKRNLEFRSTMRIAEIEDLRKRLTEIENNIYESTEEY